MGFLGFIARALSFARLTRRQGANVAVVTGDPGGGAIRTMEYMGPAGDDSPPLPGDSLACLSLPRSGGAAVVAVADTTNVGTAVAGERRLYARNPAGVPMCEIHLKADGSVEITNASGSIVLAPTGSVTINGAVTIDTAGNLTTTGTITAAEFSVGVLDFTTHVHGGVTTGAGVSGGPQ